VIVWWILPIAAYVVGSISFAWMAGRAKGIDLRQHGSGNLGATNAGRVLGTKWFVLVFSADVLKGLLPALLAVHGPGYFGHTVPAMNLLPIAVAVGAVLGHIYTCFHGFKGGKAVATSLGVLIGLLPLVAAAAFGVWLIAWLAGWAIFRLARSNAVGPASVLAAIAAPIVHVVLSPAPWGEDLPRTIFISLLALLVVVKHRSNIAKLFAKSSTPSPVK
jgi:acyl phosphate:glycerol-3-phosphate acyltransferase